MLEVDASIVFTGRIGLLAETLHSHPARSRLRESIRASIRQCIRDYLRQKLVFLARLDGINA